MENITEIQQQAGVPENLDLLSIDIDGNDYFLWEALEGYRPRVVVIEYNATFLPGESVVTPYQADYTWDGTRRYGASLDALAELGQKKGYTLAGCNSNGVNAFFVRNDLINEEFSHTAEPPSYHYCAPKFNSQYFGHPPTVEDSLKLKVDRLEAIIKEKETEILLLNDWQREREVEILKLNCWLADKEQELKKLYGFIEEKDRETNIYVKSLLDAISHKTSEISQLYRLLKAE